MAEFPIPEIGGNTGVAFEQEGPVRRGSGAGGGAHLRVRSAGGPGGGAGGRGSAGADYLFTNLFFYGRLSFAVDEPAGNHWDFGNFDPLDSAVCWWGR